MYENVSRSLQFCLHVCVLVRLVATRDKYTCASATGCSLDCASGSQIRAVIFHICARPTPVHLEGRFYVEKSPPRLQCVFVHVHCMHRSFAHFCAFFPSFFFSSSGFLPPCLFWETRGSSSSSSSRASSSESSTVLIRSFSMLPLRANERTFENSDGKTFSLHFHR